jgi:putative hemolysin
MGSDVPLRLGFSLILLLLNAMFVSAEYGLVGANRARLKSLAKKGNKRAKALLLSLDDLPRYVAATQVAITMNSLGMGTVTEPLINSLLVKFLGTVLPTGVTFFLSLLFATFIVVVFGELVPKYVSLAQPERAAMLLIGPIRLFEIVFRPLVSVSMFCARGALKPFKIDPAKTEGALSREELNLLIRSHSEDNLEDGHSQLMSKALRLDDLDADDVMIHRLDIKWIPVDSPVEGLLERVAKLGHSRIPVCKGDLDSMEGLLYVNDLLRKGHSTDFKLADLLRPVTFVPENLSVTRIISLMRESKTQVVVVSDEYGGTSGLITLEDIVEEIFGELDDQIESERPAIEQVTSTRLSVRADVRMDEVYSFLNIEPDIHQTTDTVAQVLIDALERVPKLGDKVETPFGLLRVDNMARRRITRVSIQLPERGPTS